VLELVRNGQEALFDFAREKIRERLVDRSAGASKPSAHQGAVEEARRLILHGAVP
jgi:hypothetical protein